MSNVYFLGKNTNVIDGDTIISEVVKMQDRVAWREVSIKTPTEQYYLGEYSAAGHEEWIEYNPHYVAFMEDLSGGKSNEPPRITKLFDVQKKMFVGGTQEEKQELQLCKFYIVLI